jgi:hypothetical protein
MCVNDNRIKRKMILTQNLQGNSMIKIP